MKTIIFTLLLFCISISYGQIDSIKFKKNWELKQYAQIYETQKDYPLELLYYQELLRRSKRNKEYKYKVATLLLKTRNYEAAKLLFADLIKSKNKYTNIATFYYATILKMQGKYNEAQEYFSQLSENKKFMKDELNHYKIDIQIEGIKLANDTNYHKKIYVNHLNSPINKPHLEASPIILNDTTFAFYSNSVDSIKFISNNDTTPVGKFYLATKQNSLWNARLRPPEPFNFKGILNGTFSIDKQRFYFTVKEENTIGQEVTQLYYTKKINGKWQKPQKIGNNVNLPYYNSTQPTVGLTIRNNEELIYFVSDRPGGWGGKDIWFTVYDKILDKFSEPVNAGGFINSFGDEITPFYDYKNKTMYFSSTSYPSFGGFDVYKTIGEITNWLPPENLGSPVNSSFDDVYYCLNSKTSNGFVVSNRDEAYDWGTPNCCFDIFEISQEPIKPVFVQGWLKIPDTTITENIKKSLNDTVKKETFETFVQQAIVNLQIKNQKDSSYFTIFSDTTTTNGKYSFRVPPGQSYNIYVNANGYIFSSYAFDLNEITSDTINLPNIQLEPAFQKNIVLHNILFNYDSDMLTPNSKKYLDTVIIPILQKYDNIVVEIGAHTDSKGSDEYNLELSQRRAQTVVNYLILKGIAESRLVAVGYGETIPLVPDRNPDGSDNPQARQINRRVEFKIIKLVN